MTTRFGPDSAAGDGAAFKSCCASIYGSTAIRYLLGDSWHPGGMKLTEEIGGVLGLTAADRVLDAACGQGESARALARRFGAVVVGVDLSPATLRAATVAAQEAGLARLVMFQAGDAESLPFPSGSFDVVLCECAFCTFPSKETAVWEMARVLRPGGRIAIADVTLEPGPLPEELASILGRALCIADALPLEGYASLLAGARLRILQQEDCRWAALDFLRGIDQKLLIARMAQAVGRLPLDGVDVRSARRILALARELVLTGRLSYGYIVACREDL